MTVYEQPLTYYQIVDTPLNREFEPGIRIDPSDIPFFHPEVEDTPYTLYIDESEIPRDPIPQRMAVVLGFVVVAVVLFGVFVVARWTLGEAAPEMSQVAVPLREADSETAVLAGSQAISPAFSPEVQYWADQILAWSHEHGLDPNMAATIMQIESCGDPHAVSSAGAQGLFQVMPYHFEDGENTLDPATNARRGLNYYAQQLTYFDDAYLAFAAYNGGPGNAVKEWEQWPHETQRYFYWSKGIYEDAQTGLTTSPRLQEWLLAGGASLCQQAAKRLGLP